MQSPDLSHRRNLVAAGIAGLVLAGGLFAAQPAEAAGTAFDNIDADETYAQIQAGPNVTMDVYTNPAAGITLLYYSDAFQAVTSPDSEGTVYFCLDPSTELGSFWVSNVTDLANDEETIGVLLGRLAEAYQAENPDFTLMTEEPYEVWDMNGVKVYAQSGSYTDASTNQYVEHVILVEPRDTGVLIYDAYLTEETYAAVEAGVYAAIATISTDLDTYAGKTSLEVSSDNLFTRDYWEHAGQGQSQTAPTPTPTPQSTTAAAENLKLTTFDGGFFTMVAPEGWVVYYTGDYDYFRVLAYDPADPATCLMYWGTLPFNVSQLSQDNWVAMANSTLDNNIALFDLYNAHYPVLEPATVAKAIDTMDEYAYADYQFGVLDADNLLPCTAVEVTSSTPVSIYGNIPGASQMIADEAIVSATITMADGSVCYGDFIGSIAYAGTFEMGNANAVGLWGVVAPVERYEAVCDQLSQCVGQLVFSEEYIKEGIALGEIIMSNASAYYEQMSELSSLQVQSFCDYIIGRDRYTLTDGGTLLVYYE